MGIDKLPIRIFISLGLFLLAPMAAAAQTDASDQSMIDVAFYTAALVVLLVCFLINTAIKNPPGIYYTIAFLMGVGYIWLVDGGVSVFGASDRGADQIIKTFALLTISFGIFTALSAFDPNKDLPKLKAGLWFLIGLSLLFIIPVWTLTGAWITHSLTLLFIASIVSHVLSTATWKHLDETTNQVTPVITASIALFLIGAYILSQTTGIGNSFLFSIDAAKAAFSIVLVPTLIAVIVALADVRVDRDRALEEALETARRDAETNAALLEMEKQYARARDAASTRSRQLATASHDIKQPLSSMTAELDALQVDLPEEKVRRLRRVVDHIEQLTASLSQSAHAPVESGLHGDVHIETLEISVLFDTLKRLFEADARGAGMVLNVRDGEGTIMVAPLILIRILNNVLSNAIQHSRAKQISLGADPMDDRVRITVTDDGQGFEEGAIASSFESGVKGSQSGGEGLGLAIVHELAKNYEMPIEVVSDQTGTVFAISVPKAT
ncbi:MAG: HAMP domain-containing sensor histidine kinase [Pseudomonadota bacterium]